ncbi:mitochondrial 37S ribosomal protein uS17m [Limtongia smithiae]|uniref:mitochondrial 37S ribosomal protein uS17m n=1 Tax=Limtongia smithiae TaxID=1125753 RepID=UPI0034CF36E5
MPPKQNLIGMVVSHGRMTKTVKVRVHIPVYNSKIDMLINKRKDIMVHDEGNLAREGDIVRIESTKPISAQKFFAIAEIKAPKGRMFEKYRDIGRFESEYLEFLQTQKGINAISEVKLDDSYLPLKRDELLADLPKRFSDDILQIIHRHHVPSEILTEGLIELRNKLGDNLYENADFWADLANYKAVLATVPEANPAVDDAAAMQRVEAAAKKLELLRTQIVEKFLLDEFPESLPTPAQRATWKAQKLTAEAKALLGDTATPAIVAP